PANEVHRGTADEAGDELVCRPLVELEGCADLLDLARVHDDDPVTEGHCLDLVMCHVDHGGAEAAVQSCDLLARLHTELGVEVGKRLVEQEHLWLAHDRATERDALALTARKL